MIDGYIINNSIGDFVSMMVIYCSTFKNILKIAQAVSCSREALQVTLIEKCSSFLKICNIPLPLF